MTGARSSLSTERSGWRLPAPAVVETPVARPEEIQILLLGAPGTGKTRLQSRYTLHQFIDIVPEHAHRMGSHKHLTLHDGTKVHLIIHELRTGQNRGTAGSKRSTSSTQSTALSEQDTLVQADSHLEEQHRRRLLEQSDAVMLMFNPWEQDSFDWINNKVIEDIIGTGRKNALNNDILRLLDGLAASMPQRWKSTRSGRPFDAFSKKLPRLPDEAEDSDGETSLFSSAEEKGSKDDRIDYRGELKRISIVVEGSALKKASFVTDGKGLPPPPESPMLEAEEDLDEDPRRAKRVALLIDKKHLPLIQRNSFQSVSSAYSDHDLDTIDDSRHPYTAFNTFDRVVSPDREPLLAHPIFESPRDAPMPRGRTVAPSAEGEFPVLVVATMADRLRNGSGPLERKVTAAQGQELARKFGPNCGYIEVSAKSNANVEEAYGIIVDQVIAKRNRQRRDELARARIEAAIAEAEGESGLANTARKGMLRNCAPQWLGGVASLAVSSLGSFANKLSTRPRGEGAEEVEEEAEEDVWGERVVVKTPRKSHFGAVQANGSEQHAPERMESARPTLNRTTSTQSLQRSSTSQPSTSVGRSTIFHDTKGDQPSMDTVKQGGQVRQVEAVDSAVADATGNPFVNKDFARPAKMVPVTSLEPEVVEEVAETRNRHRMNLFPSRSRRSSNTATRSKNGPTEGNAPRTSVTLRRTKSSSQSGPDRNIAATTTSPAGETDTPVRPTIRSRSASLPTLASLTRRKSSRSRKSRAHTMHTIVSDSPPFLPPLEFDAIVIDDRRASVNILVRPGDQALDQRRVSTFLAQDAHRDSVVVMLRPEEATRTLSRLIKELNLNSTNAAQPVFTTATEAMTGMEQQQQQPARTSGSVPAAAVTATTGRATMIRVRPRPAKNDKSEAAKRAAEAELAWKRRGIKFDSIMVPPPLESLPETRTPAEVPPTPPPKSPVHQRQHHNASNKAAAAQRPSLPAAKKTRPVTKREKEGMAVKTTEVRKSGGSRSSSGSSTAVNDEVMPKPLKIQRPLTAAPRMVRSGSKKQLMEKAPPLPPPSSSKQPRVSYQQAPLVRPRAWV